MVRGFSYLPDPDCYTDYRKKLIPILDLWKYLTPNSEEVLNKYEDDVMRTAVHHFTITSREG